MSTTLHARYEFAPPPTPGLLRGLVLAVAAHALLLVFLAMGVQWKHLPTPVTVEAELWSSVPQSAAEPAPEPPPVEPPAPPEPVPPVVAPKPPPVVQPPVPVAPTPDPAIAVAREKARLKKEKQDLEQQKLAQLEQEKREKEALKAKKLLAEKDARDKALKEKEQQDKLAKEKLERDKLAQKKLKDEAAAKQAAKDAAEEKKLAELRAANMKRMAGLAAGTGEPGARGTAAQSSGPSAGYAGKIIALIKSKTIFSDSTAGNPSVKVLVRVAPGGIILNSKITAKSGNNAWDDAVLRAIEKMDAIPRDSDGKIPEKIVDEGLELTVTL